ncbi:Diacylglycerol kinase 7 [Abeliophyllum distichum]|uniref:Diacylglycerol kinase 7 n=1 Tax=Abeliophyllum distichum TaxID=126358 RepID=A0ABD1RSX2_9LAMI
MIEILNLGDYCYAPSPRGIIYVPRGQPRGQQLFFDRTEAVNTEARGFVEAHADDGFLEIFGLKHGWHASMVMVELLSVKHIAQASSIRFELRGGEWAEEYMLMDGEPWKQSMNKEFSIFVEIKRVPFQSVMVHGE